jgi:hypothetical protein
MDHWQMTSGKVLENVVVPRGPDVGSTWHLITGSFVLLQKIVEFASFELVTSNRRLMPWE